MMMIKSLDSCNVMVYSVKWLHVYIEVILSHVCTYSFAQWVMGTAIKHPVPDWANPSFVI